jgi:hypothetical protein
LCFSKSWTNSPDSSGEETVLGSGAARLNDARVVRKNLENLIFVAIPSDASKKD